MSDERYTSGRSWPMAGSERREDGALGTLARPGGRPRPGRAPEGGQAGQAAQGGPGGLGQRRGRQARPVPPQRPAAGSQALPVREQGTGRPAAGQPTARAGQQPGTGRFAGVRPRPAGDAPWRVAPARRDQEPQVEAAPEPRPAAPAAAGPHRMPFVLLLCGLLGGALISALVISTTLAEGSFRISKLQDSTSTLARQRQALQDEVAQAQSAQVIEARAAKLGMRRTGELQFVNLKTGKTTNDGPTWSGAVNAPGYAP
jgi:hypothetical protein